jgi:hypothetical protein
MNSTTTYFFSKVIYSPLTEKSKERGYSHFYYSAQSQKKESKKSRRPKTKAFVRQYLDTLEHFHQIATTQEKDALEAGQVFNEFIQVLQSHIKKKQQKE